MDARNRHKINDSDEDDEDDDDDDDDDFETKITETRFTWPKQ